MSSSRPVRRPPAELVIEDVVVGDRRRGRRRPRRRGPLRGRGLEHPPAVRRLVGPRRHVPLRPGRRPGHQGLGPGRGRHEGRRAAPHRDPAAPGLRQGRAPAGSSRAARPWCSWSTCSPSTDRDRATGAAPSIQRAPRSDLTQTWAFPQARGPWPRQCDGVSAPTTTRITWTRRQKGALAFAALLGLALRRPLPDLHLEPPRRRRGLDRLDRPGPAARRPPLHEPRRPQAAAALLRLRRQLLDHPQQQPDPGAAAHRRASKRPPACSSVSPCAASGSTAWPSPRCSSSGTATFPFNDAHAAGFEAFMLLPITLAWYWSRRGRAVLAALALVVAVLIKQPAAFTIVPVVYNLWRRPDGRRQLAILTATGAGAYLAVAAAVRPAPVPVLEHLQQRQLPRRLLAARHPRRRPR